MVINSTSEQARLENGISFRWCVGHPEVAGEYARVKTWLAAAHPNSRIAYTDNALLDKSMVLLNDVVQIR